MRLKLSDHAHTRLVERGIDIGKVKKVLQSPDFRRRESDGTLIARKKLEDERELEVVYKMQPNQLLIITFYYVYENQSR